MIKLIKARHQAVVFSEVCISGNDGVHLCDHVLYHSIKALCHLLAVMQTPSGGDVISRP